MQSSKNLNYTKSTIAVLTFGGIGLLVMAGGLVLHAWQHAHPRDPFQDEMAKASQGDVRAQYHVGVCYFNGRLVKEDQAQAAFWWRKAAEQNFGPAQRLMSYCCGFGLGVPRDREEGAKWFRKAAARNSAEMQNELGSWLHTGSILAQDEVEGVKWYRQAAGQNYAEAQFNLGGCYHFGRGVEMDVAEAVKWYRKGAEQGHLGALNNLGICYLKGEGVGKNVVEAYAWLNAAATKEGLVKNFRVFREPAAETRDQLEKTMLPIQITAAKQRTEELRAQIKARRNVDWK